MNGGLTECGTCGYDPCRCVAIREQKAQKRIIDGQEVVEVALDVFAKARWVKLRIMKRLWPDIKRLEDALDDYQDKS